MARHTGRTLCLEPRGPGLGMAAAWLRNRLSARAGNKEDRQPHVHRVCSHVMGSPGKPSPGESRPQGILGASRRPFLGLSCPHSSTPTVPIEPKSGETGDSRDWAGTGAGTCRNGKRKGWGHGTTGRLWESSRTTIGSLKSQGSERSLRRFCRKILPPHCFGGTPGRKPAGASQG